MKTDLKNSGVADLTAIGEFPAAQEPRRSRLDVLQKLCEVARAVSGFSVLLEDDFSPTGPIAVKTEAGLVVEIRSAINPADCNIFSRDNPIGKSFLERFVGNMMQPIAMARRELLDDAGWTASAYVSGTRRQRGLGDCLISVIDLPGRRPFLELVCLDRLATDSSAFTAADGRAVQTAHAAYSAVDRADPDAVSEDPGDSDLAMQKILSQVLKGESEEQIATSLGIGRARLDQLLKSLCAEFNVSGINELKSRWGNGRRTAR